MDDYMMDIETPYKIANDFCLENGCAGIQMKGTMMYEVKLDWKRLRAGGEVKCPECKKGVMKAKDFPHNTHNFKCDKCGVQINID